MSEINMLCPHCQQPLILTIEVKTSNHKPVYTCINHRNSYWVSASAGNNFQLIKNTTLKDFSFKFVNDGSNNTPNDGGSNEPA